MSEKRPVEAKTINSVISNFKDNKRQEEDSIYKNRYIIPNFQRGYRWTKSEVEQLLNDIWTAKTTEMKTYCLQPVVLLGNDETEESEGKLFGTIQKYITKSWRVIDGQQRLTTIFLLLQYLSQTNNQEFDCYDIEYENRSGTTKKINNWVEAMIDYNPRKDDAIPGIVFEENDGLDIYYMQNALKTIDAWFTNNASIVNRNDFNTYLREKVVVLWYEFAGEEENEEDDISLFLRINMGKIPLTISELLKAILLKKEIHGLSSFDNKDNKETRDIKAEKNEQLQENAEQKQYQRAVQWDKMDQTLSDDSFFRFINSDEIIYETRMDYLFSLEYLLEPDHKDVDKVPSKEVIFRFYEDKIGNNSEQQNNLWDNLTLHFNLLQEWYKDRIAFHKIGYIISISGNSAVTLRNLITKYKNCYGKNEFYGKILDQEICDITKIKLKVDYNGIDDLSFDSKDTVRDILLLFNVLTAMESPDYRFAFEYVTPLKECASVEHVFPQTPKIDDIVNSIKRESKDLEGKDALDRKKSAIVIFVEKVREEFKMRNIEFPELDIDFSGSNDDAYNTSLESWWKKILTKLEMTETNIQGIGNLALISKNLNSELQNDMFYRKQQKIKNFDKRGLFIPICTHNVFLKYYSVKEGSDTSKLFWNLEDIEMHKESIKTMLKDYLSHSPVAELEGENNE